ncbi:MAG TPA: DMT family transporter [Vicinamibacteria bacterium]|nr:DMT family transporter [Vicinamibacteria bacterium]
MSPEPGLRRGALYMVLGALFFALMGLCVKLASRTLGNAMIVFARNAFGLVALLPWVLRLEGGLRTRHLPEHLVRSGAGLAAMYCFFHAIAHMRLADAVLLNYSLPLFMPVIAWLWLGEAIPRGLWRGILLGLLGVALILKPGRGVFEPVALFGVASAVLAAVAQVGVRRLTGTEPVIRIVLYFGLVSTAVSAVPLAWAWRAPHGFEWALLATIGVAATIAQMFLTQAYAQAPAAQVGPFIYACVPFAALLDALVLGLLPDAWSAAGALLVCAAGIFVLRT